MQIEVQDKDPKSSTTGHTTEAHDSTKFQHRLYPATLLILFCAAAVELPVDALKDELNQAL